MKQSVAVFLKKILLENVYKMQYMKNGNSIGEDCASIDIHATRKIFSHENSLKHLIELAQSEVIKIGNKKKRKGEKG